MSPAGPERPPKGPSRPPARSRPGHRSRRIVLVACCFAAAVLLTSFPATALFDQHHQLDATAAQLARIEQQNRELARQVQQLSSSGTVDQVARSNYGMVPAGQHAYDIVPPAGTSGAAASPGQGSLQGPPVVPGSSRAEELAGLGGVTGGQPPTSGSASHHHAAPPGFFSRLWRDLQFWH